MRIINIGPCDRVVVDKLLQFCVGQVSQQTSRADDVIIQVYLVASISNVITINTWYYICRSSNACVFHI